MNRKVLLKALLYFGILAAMSGAFVALDIFYPKVFHLYTIFATAVLVFWACYGYAKFKYRQGKITDFDRKIIKAIIYLEHKAHRRNIWKSVCAMTSKDIGIGIVYAGLYELERKKIVHVEHVTDMHLRIYKVAKSIDDQFKK